VGVVVRLALALVMVIAVSALAIRLRPRQSLDQDLSSFDSPAASPEQRNRLAELLVALRNSQAALVEVLGSAADDGERHRILLSDRDECPLPRAIVAQARSSPTDPMAALALATIVNQYPDTSEGKEAADLILKQHLLDESPDSMLEQLAQSESGFALEILRAAYGSIPESGTKGRAGFALARFLKTRAERDGWRNVASSRADLALAEPLFEETLVRYPNLRVGQRTLADVARSELDESHSLSVGNIAPEIKGEDTEGQLMQLSDHRGKVVVLSFWGNWCSLCRSMFPYERMLVDRMKGRPFVLLGVNSDSGTDIARSLVEDKTVTWRSWKDGGELHGGAIARRWNVQPLPDVFILDDRGVIRHHVGPHSDDHGPVYFLDADGKLVHRWRARSDEVMEVAEALVREIESHEAANH
jgi:peroxiredoxin